MGAFRDRYWVSRTVAAMSHGELRPILFNDLLNSGRMYQVSNFQRHYSWNTDIAVAFMSELIEEVESYSEGNILFRGVVTGYRIDNAQPDLLEVVDGQQRMATIVLASVVSRQLFPDVPLYIESMAMHSSFGQPPALRIQFPYVRGANDEFKQICEVSTGSYKRSKADLKKMSKTGSTMWSVAHALHELFAAQFAGDPERLAAFWRRLLQFGQVVLHVTPSRAHARRQYRQINTHQAPLVPAELIKETVISAAEMLPPSPLAETETAADRVVELWDGLQNDDLFYALVGMYGGPQTVIRENNMYEWLDDHRADPGIEVDTNPVGFATKVRAAADAIRHLQAGQTPAGVSDPFAALVATSTSKSPPPLVVAASHLDAALMAPFFRRLAGYITLVSLSKLRGQDLARYQLGLLAGLRGLPSSDVTGLHGLFDRIQSEIVEATAPTIRASLLSPISKSNRMRLLLLASSTCEPDEGSVVRLLHPSTFDVEHVYPLSAAAGEIAWDGRAESGGEDADASGDSAVCPLPEQVALLGNLTLLRPPKNRSVKDAAFAVKREFYGKEDLATLTRAAGPDISLAGFSCAEREAYQATRACDPPRDWDASRVTERTEFMARRVLQACGLVLQQVDELIAPTDNELAANA